MFNSFLYFLHGLLATLIFPSECLAHLVLPFHSFFQHLDAGPHYFTTGFLCLQPFLPSSQPNYSCEVNVQKYPCAYYPSLRSLRRHLLEKHKKQKPECLNGNRRCQETVLTSPLAIIRRPSSLTPLSLAWTAGALSNKNIRQAANVTGNFS